MNGHGRPPNFLALVGVPNSMGMELHYKKREAEYQATIAAMQNIIEELEGTQKQLSQMYVFVAFCQFCVRKPCKGELLGW